MKKLAVPTKTEAGDVIPFAKPQRDPAVSPPDRTDVIQFPKHRWRLEDVKHWEPDPNDPHPGKKYPYDVPPRRPRFSKFKEACERLANKVKAKKDKGGPWDKPKFKYEKPELPAETPALSEGFWLISQQRGVKDENIGPFQSAVQARNYAQTKGPPEEGYQGWYLVKSDGQVARYVYDDTKYFQRTGAVRHNVLFHHEATYNREYNASAPVMTPATALKGLSASLSETKAALRIAVNVREVTQEVLDAFRRSGTNWGYKDVDVFGLSGTTGVRDWGEWEGEDGRQEPTAATMAKAKAIIDPILAKFPGFKIFPMVEKNNWLDFEVHAPREQWK